MADEIAVTFLPVATMRLREDGRWDLNIDWASSVSVATVNGRDVDVQDDADDDIGYVSDAAEALDDWRIRQPENFILSRPQY